ncbi:MAG: GAF domain-containing protein [Microscillaceae bacterium]|nr:GAF domain-containing protein [Microscillaceae bacterium]
MGNIHRYWEYLTGIGLRPEMSFLLQQRIRLSNLVGLIVGGIGSFYLLVVILLIRGNFAAAWTLLPLSFFGWGVLVFNRLGLNVVSRLSMSILPALTTLWLNLNIKLYTPDKIGLIHYISPRFFIISTVVIPMVLFTRGEQLYLIFSVAVILFCGVFGYRWLHEVLGLTLQDLGIPGEAYSTVMTEDITFVIVNLLVVLIFSRYLNGQFERNTHTLLSEANEKNRQLNEREKHLKEILLDIKQRQLDEEKQAWVAEGLARFSRILQIASLEASFYKKFLHELIKYLQAGYGAFYLMEESAEKGQMLVWQAGYIPHRQEQHRPVFALGEGLPGQCARDGKTIYLTELPASYPSLDAGLDKIRMKSLLVVALKFNDEAEGVIEILSLHDFEAHHIEFVEKLAENTAALLTHLKANLRTQQILDNSQRMFKQLREAQQTWKTKEQEYQYEIETLQAALRTQSEASL